jgi:peroxiredoxin
MRLRKEVLHIIIDRAGCGFVLSALIAVVVAVAAPGISAYPEMAPDFTADRCYLADSLTLSDFFDSPVVLFFFDAGDVACFETYPYVDNWHQKYAADDVKVIGIHSPYYAPTRSWENAVTALARSDLKIPVAMDFDRRIFRSYSLEGVPVLLLLEPGGKITASASDPSEYRALETAIQNLLRKIEPNVVLPFLYEPRARTKKHGTFPPPTPRLVLGYASGDIANADSAALNSFHRYVDPREKARGKAYLKGRWKLEDSLVTYEEGEAAHIRVVYSGQDVWLLPDFDLNQNVRVYVEQDREPLPGEIRGSDVLTDISARTFITMRYAVPLHVIRNPTYGTHELRIIPEEGTVSFLYLFFEGAK